MDEYEKRSVTQWVDTAAGGIRFKPDREEVARELREHIEDRAADLERIFPGIGREEAEARALEGMGDPEEIGKELARVHRPWLGWLWRASKVLLALVCLGLVLNGLYWGEDAFLGDDPYCELWDWDGLPGNSITGVDTIMKPRYLPGEDPNQLWALEPGMSRGVDGQRISLLRTALWQEEGRQALYTYLRVDCPRFWERGVLLSRWMRVTDSLGNTYPLGADSPESEEGWLLNTMSDYGYGYGPFHWGAELIIGDLDPAAEWVRLDYGLGEPIFSFTIKLREGTP